jgi:hypothetical protein
MRHFDNLDSDGPEASRFIPDLEAVLKITDLRSRDKIDLGRERCRKG